MDVKRREESERISQRWLCLSSELMMMYWKIGFSLTPFTDSIYSEEPSVDTKDTDWREMSSDAFI